MKFLAHIDRDTQSEIVSIQDVVIGVNRNPAYWEKKTFYSLWYLTPMNAKPNGKKVKPHFAFKKGHGGNENSGGGESIEHDLSKKVIFDNKFLDIKIGGIKDRLYFSRVVIEQSFNKGERRADLYVQIKTKNRFDFPVGQGLVIEIHKSNRVTKTKRKFYRDLDKSAIEIDLDKTIKYNGNITTLYEQLTKYFKQEIEAISLHDSNWKRHKKEREQRELIKKKRELEIKRQETEKRKEEFLQLQQQYEKERLLKVKPDEVKIEIETCEEETKSKSNIFQQIWIKLFR